MIIEIIHPPVSWKSHQGFGRRAYNPRFRERSIYQKIIGEQWGEKEIISCCVRVDILYQMRIPKVMEKKLDKKIPYTVVWHAKRPDIDNLNKFTVDCLKNIALKDDSQVAMLTARKIYGLVPKTLLRISTL